ncbi:MAG: hypothetical protein QM710_00830 [Flavobacterium sp.]
MNDAHLHMVVNHFPIIGTIFGLGILIAGIAAKNNAIKNVAYVLFVVGALFTLASMSTGEGAEELVENLPDVGHHIIHEHEELAEKFAIVSYLLGVVSIIGWFANIKNHGKAKLVSFVVLIIAVIAVIMAKSVGTSGGEVRHTEIRENNAQAEHHEDND